MTLKATDSVGNDEVYLAKALLQLEMTSEWNMIARSEFSRANSDKNSLGGKIDEYPCPARIIKRKRKKYVAILKCSSVRLMGRRTNCN